MSEKKLWQAYVDAVHETESAPTVENIKNKLKAYRAWYKVFVGS